MILPLVTALGTATVEGLRRCLFRSAKAQENGATGAAAVKQAIGARAFMGEMIDLLRDHVKETVTYLVLPAMPASGKAPPRGAGSADPALASAPAPATSTPSPVPAPTAVAAAAAASASAFTTIKQQNAANHKVIVEADKVFVALVNEKIGHQEVSTTGVSSCTRGIFNL